MIKKDICARDIVLGNKRPIAIDQLAEKFGLDAEELDEAVIQLQKEGFGIEKEGNILYRRSVEAQDEPVDLSERFKRHFKFGAVSDTHFGSKKARADALEEYYDIAKAEGVKDVFHSGDITDGVDVYKGQPVEQEFFSQDDQVDKVVREYPKRKGMTTRFITGNHDLREYQHGGADVGKQIADQRDDMQYLGQIDRTIQLSEGGITAELIHPAGAQSYALSYKSQKDLQSRNPDDTPDIYLSGHYHQAWYGHYKGVEVLNVPSFKDDGLWERRLGLTGTVGGWIVEGTMEEDGEKIRRFKPELVTFRKK